MYATVFVGMNSLLSDELLQWLISHDENEIDKVHVYTKRFPEADAYGRFRPLNAERVSPLRERER